MADFIDKAKHKAEEIGGSAKESVGDVTGNDDLKAEGKADQAKASVSQTADKVSDVAGDVKDAVTDKASDLEGTANDVKDAAGDVKDAVADKAQEAKHQLSSAADEFSSKVQNIDTNDIQSAIKSNLPVIAAGVVGAVVAIFFITKKRRESKIAAQSFNWSDLTNGLADSWSELTA